MQIGTQVPTQIKSAFQEYDERVKALTNEIDAKVQQLNAKIEEHQQKFEEVNLKVPELIGKVQQEVEAMGGIQQKMQQAWEDARQMQEHAVNFIKGEQEAATQKAEEAMMGIVQQVNAKFESQEESSAS